MIYCYHDFLFSEEGNSMSTKIQTKVHYESTQRHKSYICLINTRFILITNVQYLKIIGYISYTWLQNRKFSSYTEYRNQYRNSAPWIKGNATDAIPHTFMMMMNQSMLAVVFPNQKPKCSIVRKHFLSSYHQVFHATNNLTFHNKVTILSSIMGVSQNVFAKLKT